MNKKNKKSKLFASINNYIVFFLLIAFVITCCLMLFTTILTKTMGITLTSDDLGAAAKLTFANVIFFSIAITTIDHIRRKLTVDRPVKRIIDATEKIMQGDFSARIQTNPNSHTESSFNEIADCINQMAEELSGIETLRTDFVANVSHELKTPLSVMKNYGTLLQQKDLSEEKRIEYAKAITEASRRLADLISNILKLNKLENQQIFPTNETFNLSEQLCECLLNYENIWEEKEIELETDIEDDVMITTDPEMLSIVWNNLFSNAFKFTGKNGKVSLSLKSENEYAIIKISDTGIGISKEVGKHIFDKFYQGDTSHATQGNGLGLALVKRIIDITGSDILVESSLNVGTTFTVKMQRSKND